MGNGGNYVKALNMNVAVVGTSKKENEKRVAIHPEQIKSIPENIRRNLFFEKGYGMPFGVSDEEIATLTGNQLLDRKILFENFKAIIIPKPVEEDFEEMQEGTRVWGWVHTVQQRNIAQIAMDKKLTLITWENMYYQGSRSRTHIFQKNNEMAGYCGVQQALQLKGIDGNFGAPRKVIVFSFGSVSRGAINALRGHGFSDVTVFTQRPTYLISDKIPGIQYRQIHRIGAESFQVENISGELIPIIEELINADIIVNGVLQNPNAPVMWINENDIIKFRKECLVIDISCDKGMGFSFAHSSDSRQPLYKEGNISYYCVDHTPTLLWEGASWEISNCIVPLLQDFVEENYNAVLNGAIDIREGVIINKDILTFQNRLQN